MSVPNVRIKQVILVLIKARKFGFVVLVFLGEGLSV